MENVLGAAFELSRSNEEIVKTMTKMYFKGNSEDLVCVPAGIDRSINASHASVQYPWPGPTKTIPDLRTCSLLSITPAMFFLQ